MMYADLRRFAEADIPPVRADWLSRSTESDPVHAKLRTWVCQPTQRYLWIPADMITFTPALLSRVYGDGRALIGLSTIHQRPAFYIIRIDSSWTLHMDSDFPSGGPEYVEFHEEICFALEEEFGHTEADEEEDDPEILENGNPWPAFNDRDGSSWWRMEWPALLGLQFEPHPYSWRGNLLAPNNGRSA